MKTWYAELYENGTLFARLDCDTESQAAQAVRDWQKAAPGDRSGQFGPRGVASPLVDPSTETAASRQ